jgi:hypothetical protein
LFADFVVVTESPIDSVVIEQLLRDANVDIESLGMSILTVDGVASLPHMFHLLQALSIPAAFVVDKDYFVPYRNGNVRANSLDGNGYPTYAASARRGTLLFDLFPREKDRGRVVAALVNNHTQAMDLLQQVRFFCFRFALEVDLVAARATRERLYELARIPETARTERALLGRKDALKDQSTLLRSMSGLSAAQLPNSFKRLRKELPLLARDAQAI